MPGADYGQKTVSALAAKVAHEQESFQQKVQLPIRVRESGESIGHLDSPQARPVLDPRCGLRGLLSDSQDSADWQYYADRQDPTVDKAHAVL